MGCRVLILATLRRVKSDFAYSKELRKRDKVFLVPAWLPYGFGSPKANRTRAKRE